MSDQAAHSTETFAAAATADPPTTANGQPPQERAGADAQALAASGYDFVAQYQSLAARLLFAGESERFTLAVTSSVSGEGVTTVCVGLALALASSTSKSVLLLDANLRRPALHRAMGLPVEPGLHELILADDTRERRAEAAEALPHVGVRAFRSWVPNLWLLPTGAAMAQPAQLMTSEAARAQIARLRERFDYVVMDCPPLLTAVDSASVCRLANGVVIVVRAGLTPRDDVVRARSLLQGAPVMGVVLNGV